MDGPRLGDFERIWRKIRACWEMVEGPLEDDSPASTRIFEPYPPTIVESFTSDKPIVQFIVEGEKHEPAPHVGGVPCLCRRLPSDFPASNGRPLGRQRPHREGPVSLTPSDDGPITLYLPYTSSHFTL